MKPQVDAERNGLQTFPVHLERDQTQTILSMVGTIFYSYKHLYLPLSIKAKILGVCSL